MSIKLLKRLARKSLAFVGLEDLELVGHRYLQTSYHWSDFPKVIQLDLCNRCGPKYCGLLCSYCRPQRDIQNGLKYYREMDDEVFSWVLKDVSRYGRNMDFICDFLDGDGLDPCLPDKRRQIKEAAPWLRVQTFTSGTRPDYAYLLTGQELDWICVTLSAHNPELYKQVHCGNKFVEVLKTMRYLTEHHRPSQLLEVHCVVTKYNINYLGDWLRFVRNDFPEWKPKFSVFANTEDPVANLAVEGYSTEDQEKAIANVGADFWERNALSNRRPCVLWDNDDVSADGWLLQCCRWGNRDFDYGNAKEYIKNGWGFRDYHMKKIINKLRNPFCDRCNMKAPDWQKRLSKIDVRGIVRP